MTSKNIVNKDYWLFPDKPLTLVKFIIVNDNGNSRCGLKLSTPVQQIVFENITHLIGEKLTFIVPLYIYDNEKKLYMIDMPRPHDIIIENVNGAKLPITIIKSRCEKLYFIMISVTDCSINDCCKLILYVVKFNLFLCDVICCKCCDDDKKNCHDDNKSCHDDKFPIDKKSCHDIESDKCCDKCDACGDCNGCTVCKCDNCNCKSCVKKRKCKCGCDKCDVDCKCDCDNCYCNKHDTCGRYVVCLDCNKMDKCISPDAWKWHAGSLM